MKIEDLKFNIEHKAIGDEFIIFKSESDFIPRQYIHEIAKIKNYDIKVIEDLNTLTTNDIFSFIEEEPQINVYSCNNLDFVYNLDKQKNLYIICNKLDKDSIEAYQDFIIDVPKLNEWQIQDYAYSLAEGVDQKDLDSLIELCKKDIYLIDSELQKLCLFQPSERKYVFNTFIDEGIFQEMSKYTIFNLTNCIIKKDFNTLKAIYKEIDNIDVEPIGLVTILLTNFRNIISVQLSPSPSAEACGLNPKQFWAIKYSCGAYTKEELLNIFGFLSNIDKRIKTGQLPVDKTLVDYLITHILSI